LRCSRLFAQSLKPTVPGAQWQRAKPEALRGWLKTQQTKAIMLVYRGHVIFEYGELNRVSKIASVRKSILAMLFGNYVAAGKVDFDKAVEQLGLTDVQPFLPIEKYANLGHLVTARSGIPFGECGVDGSWSEVASPDGVLISSGCSEGL